MRCGGGGGARCGRLLGGGVLAAVGGGGVLGAYFLQRQHQRGMVERGVVYAPRGRLTVPARSASLDKLRREKFDVLIIGGGATGAGVAVDCATRGLKAALIEENDFGGGTSSKSTKLIHGGIRYLEQAFKTGDVGQLSLVAEALEERAHMLKAFPHAAKPLPIVMPIYKWWQVPYFWSGVVFYDVIARFVTGFDTGVPSSFLLWPDNALFYFPNLKKKGLKAALVYYDGQHNDSRTNVALALTAAAAEGVVPGTQPAVVLNHVSLEKFLKSPTTDKIIGALVRDQESGEEIEVFAKVAVNCTGPNADAVRRLADPTCEPRVSTAAGTHLVVAEHVLPDRFGMIIPKTSDGRVLFALPWEQGAVIGTTDEKVPFTKEPQSTAADVNFLCSEMAQYLEYTPEELKANVTSAWRGLRPLVTAPARAAAAGGDTKSLSRSHEIIDTDAGGLVSLVGGKWTTYRRMAQDLVDHIVQTRNLEPRYPCRTKRLKTFYAIDVGAPAVASGIAAGGEAVGGDAAGAVTTAGAVAALRSRFAAPSPGSAASFAAKLQREFSIDFSQASYLVRNYGFAARTLCREGAASGELHAPLVPGLPFSAAEVRFAARHELARTCEDVLARRVRVGFVDAAAALACVERVADVLADELAWSRAKRADQVRMCCEMIAKQFVPEKPAAVKAEKAAV